MLFTMKKTIQTLVMAWMLLGGASQWLAQKKHIQNTQKQTVEVLINDYDHIIKQPFSSIITKYWPIEWIEIIKKNLLLAINKERAKVWADSLKINNHLQSATQEHAQFLYDHKKEYIDTNGNQLQDVHWQFLPNGKSRSLLDRVLEAGYWSVFVNENICIGAKTIEAVVEWWWMFSPSHKKTMLSTEYQEIWIYVVDDIVVVKFWKPDPKHRNRKVKPQ